MDAHGQFRLRDWTTADSSAVIHLNDAEIPHVTLLAATALERLAGQACSFRLAESNGGEIAGFILALDERAEYASVNFQWFKARYPRFVYIDRVVVAAPHQRLGVGRLLYSDLETAARRVAPLLSCEVNLRPANPGSLGFHQKLGFREVGTQETEGGKKTVALMIKELL